MFPSLLRRQPERTTHRRPVIAGQRWTAIPVDTGPDAGPEYACPVRLYTATHVVTGSILGTGRLSDLLNEREEIRVDDAVVAALGSASEAMNRVPSVSIDPFEIEIAMVRRQPDEPWTRARRIHKVVYPVLVDAAPFEIQGKVHVFPGIDPANIARASVALFVPLTEPTARRRGRLISDPTVDAVLVNRHLIRQVRQFDPPEVLNTGAILARRRGIAAPA